ncbi:DUF72 domain-containing protein [Desulfatiglans anilini]|uniref:DUF72 domain-containing protein n=1 Tax=Desulfatiglans anilini TaxID=90728 RepID=UPI0004219078|nr:DUF72 domain-containing protein [Desulfatiglans anilini]
MAELKNVHVGTSGWHYKHWAGPFYPEDMHSNEYLQYYVQHLHTVEINNSFYQLPKAETLASWRKTVPEGFKFAVKASRYITHMKKLKDSKEALNVFLKRVDVLGDKLGPILFQLPPRWRFNADRLYDFLKMLPNRCRYAFEFRDVSWMNPEAYEALKLFGAAFCIYDLAGYQSPKETTADFIYIRLHGPGGAYKGNYSVAALSGWAGAVSTWAEMGSDVFCYFDTLLSKLGIAGV